GLALTGWAPFVYFWQDFALAVVAVTLDLAAKRSIAAWAVYGLAVGYVAINVPIAVVLGSPLTLAMIRATGGPLRDSIARYVTLANVGNVALVAAVGATIPVVLKGRPRRWSIRA